MAAAVQEAIYLRALLKDFGFPIRKQIDIGEDHQSCIKMWDYVGTPNNTERFVPIVAKWCQETAKKRKEFDQQKVQVQRQQWTLLKDHCS